MYAAARQGHLPTCFSCVNTETESPRVAVLAQTILAIAISFVGDLDALIGYVMFGFWAQRIFTLVALLIIRHNRIPVHAEAVRVPLCIYAFLAITIALVVIPIFQEFSVTALAIAICLVGFIMYFVFVHPQKLPSWMYRVNHHRRRVSQKRILCQIFTLMRKTSCCVATAVQQASNFCMWIPQCTLAGGSDCGRVVDTRRNCITLPLPVLTLYCSSSGCCSSVVTGPSQYLRLGYIEI
ncbi:hypothetical protein OESDEN_13494 [Oesophagostomum dentatum]|uniref:Uncharacterized protein n=1 Tax=Oesophagostomum dentatum TaxID=61180 RepID=A0A0B1SS82_OESDE|nr:hypothetical protein OESDEN_13494 [Oesophagostomum dentatum]